MKDSTKKILRFVATPQIMPRAREFVASGFSYVAYYMALAYRAARLLPAEHPYLRAANLGRFTIRNVVAEAAGTLVYKKENIDQIIVFWLILVGLAIMVMQFLLLGLGLFANIAHAGPMTMPSNYGQFFITTAPTYDIAFVLLDRVFGVPGLFGSCVDQGVPCYNNAQADAPYQFHAALHAVFQYYSIGLLVVAALILCYFIFAILAETAQTGTPFGKRFNHVWAPLRLVTALGLLIPLSTGLNSAQYITLYAAKWGSGFATNGWLQFVATATATDTLLGPQNRLVAIPRTPSISALVVFFSAVATCARGVKKYDNTDIEAYLINPISTVSPPPTLAGTPFALASGTYYSNMNLPGGGGMTKTTDGTRILVYFGVAALNGRPQPFPSKPQDVAPLCGSLTFEISDINATGSPGSNYMMEKYYEMIQDLWAAARPGGTGGGAVGSITNVTAQIGEAMSYYYLPIDRTTAPPPLPARANMDAALQQYEAYIKAAIATAANMQQSSSEWVLTLNQLGWAGAAIWYNQIATLNGALIGSVENMPTPFRYPEVMEEVVDVKGGLSQFLPATDRFRPRTPEDKPVELEDPDDYHMADALYHSVEIWDPVGGQPTGLFIVDMINAVFGFDGLFNMQDNPNIHPLAQLVAIGKGIVNSAVTNLGTAFVGFAVATGARALEWGTALSAVASFHGTVAMIALGVGFVLFYVIPFLPFIYFFFAVGAWIKTIFEAMVGVPLWALAHLRIDGDGLPGDAAMGGYYLILDIFLRPILIIFGLLGGITIFGAQVMVLNEVWSLVTSNVAGFDRQAAAAVGPPVMGQAVTGALDWLRSPIDEFFFTVIYAIVVYMMALSSFKMVDMVPNYILRWMGSSVQTFGDQSGDEAANLMRNSMLGGTMITGQLKGSVQSAMQVPNQALDLGKRFFGGGR